MKPPTPWHLYSAQGTTGTVPPIPGVILDSAPSPQTDALIALPGADIAQVYRDLWSSQQPLLPIIDAGAHLPRADATINVPSAEYVMRALDDIRPLQARLETIPVVSAEQRDQFLPLAMAYSRNTDLKAQLTAHRAHVTAYPALIGLPVSRKILADLATQGMLTERFFQRVHECVHCQSARLVAQEECEACHSSHIEPIPIVHHYSCGHQALRPHFVQGDRLVCPKCHERLRHYGVDYDVSGEINLCHNCGHQSGDLEVGFICMDCGHHTPAKDSNTRDIHHYALTPDGEQAVLSGALPGVLGQDGEPARMISVEELDRLVVLEQRRTRRSKRPHMVMRVTLSADQERAQSLGLASLNSLYAQAAHVIAEHLRDSDLVAWRGPRIYLLMPDTAPDNAPTVIGKLDAALSALYDVQPRFALLQSEGTTTSAAEHQWTSVQKAS